MFRGQATFAHLVSCHLVTLLGAARSRSGERRARMAESKLRRRHGFGVARFLSRSFAAAGKAARAHRHSGGSPATGLAASGAMRAFPGPAAFAVHHGSYNSSANTDRVTAGFACLRASGCLQRYTSERQA
jgi:hypothetical protein